MVIEIHDRAQQTRAAVPDLLAEFRSPGALRALKSQQADFDRSYLLPGAAPGAALTDEQKQTLKAKVCPASLPYMSFIDKAAEIIHDPKVLGDIKALRHKFDCQIASTDDAIKRAQEALTVTGDKFNHVMSPREVADFEAAQAGRVVGIGLRLYAVPAPNPVDAGRTGDSKPHNLVGIDEVIDDTPAQRAGLKSGDVILSVDGVSTLDKSPGDVSQAIRGEEKQPVDLTLLRNGQELHEHLTRETYSVSDVSEPKDMGNGVTYIRIYSFGSERTGQQLEAAMKSRPDTKAWVIDVRGNSGGFISSALAAAELFVEKGTLLNVNERVQSDIHNPKFKDTRYSVDGTGLLSAQKVAGSKDQPKVLRSARLSYAANHRPVVLIADSNTASAAEIFEGAVHDSGGATTVGWTSFGKGIGQTYIPWMPGGTALKVTSLEYTTPGGKWPGNAGTRKIGLDPDNFVANPAGGARIGSPSDLQLPAAVRLARQKAGT